MGAATEGLVDSQRSTIPGSNAGNRPSLWLRWWNLTNQKAPSCDRRLVDAVPGAPVGGDRHVAPVEGAVNAPNLYTIPQFKTRDKVKYRRVDLYA